MITNNSDKNGLIVHICKHGDWEQATSRSAYQADSLFSEGFIHCSQPGQVLEVANRFFAQEQDLVLLWLDPKLVQADIRWEPADGLFFPHIYGPINLEAVKAVKRFKPDSDGIFRQLPGSD